LQTVPADAVLAAAQNPMSRARLIAAAAPSSGAFLQVVPMSSVVTRLNDTAIMGDTTGGMGDISPTTGTRGYMRGHVMLPATALVMFETYVGHRLLSASRPTLKCQQWGGTK
jgi:hypothetical protein